MDFAAFRTFWELAVNIAVFTATPALQHGYGMSATEEDASTTLLTDAVNNFGAAYAATQESLRSNNATISAVQGQLQMLCNAIGNQPPPNMIQCGRGGGALNGGGGGGGYNGGGNNPPQYGGTSFPQGSGAYNGGSGGYNNPPACPSHLHPSNVLKLELLPYAWRRRRRQPHERVMHLPR